MIRYPMTRAELEGRIEHYERNDLGKTRATWLDRARSRTEHFREVHHYNEPSGIWSEIKPVFMRLQHNTVIGSDATAAKKSAACQDLERLKASGSPHASYIRAMSALCATDPDAAESHFNESREFLKSLHDRESKSD